MEYGVQSTNYGVQSTDTFFFVKVTFIYDKSLYNEFSAQDDVTYC